MITGEGDWHNLLYLMLVFTVIQITATMLNTYYWSEIWWRYVGTRFFLMGKKNNRLWFISGCAANVLWALSQATVYGWLIYAVVNRNMTIGNFSLYMASAGIFFQYISTFLNNIGELLARSREMDDFRSFLDLGEKENKEPGRQVPALSSYEVEFRGVSFRYPKAERYASRNRSADLESLSFLM